MPQRETANDHSSRNATMASRRLTVTGALEVSRYTKSYAKFTNIFSRKY